MNSNECVKVAYVETIVDNENIITDLESNGSNSSILVLADPSQLSVLQVSVIFTIFVNLDIQT